MYLVDGSGIAGDHEGIVYVKFAAAQLRFVGRHDGDFFAAFRTVIGDQNGGDVINNRFHTALEGLSVFADDGNRISFGEGICFQIQSHVTVQRKNGQSTMLYHHIADLIALFTVENLHPSGHTGSNAGTGLVAVSIGDLVIQIINFCLQVRHGAADSGHIGGGQQLTVGDSLTVFYQNFQQFHTGRYFDRFCIHIFQNTAAGYYGADGAGSHLVGQNIICRRAVFLLNVVPQNGDSDGERNTHHKKQNQYGGDNSAFFLLSGFVQCFEQRIIALFHCFLRSRLRYLVHFILCRHRDSFRALKALHF